MVVVAIAVMVVVVVEKVVLVVGIRGGTATPLLLAGNGIVLAILQGGRDVSGRTGTSAYKLLDPSSLHLPMLSLRSPPPHHTPSCMMRAAHPSAW